MSSFEENKQILNCKVIKKLILDTMKGVKAWKYCESDFHESFKLNPYSKHSLLCYNRMLIMIPAKYKLESLSEAY